MNQHDAPVGTVATIGHPANNCLIVRFSDGWRYVESGDVVDNENFRAGWDLVSTPHPRRDPTAQVTAITDERLRVLRQEAREQPRSPFVDPRQMREVRAVLTRRGETWAQTVVGRTFDRRSRVDASIPWLNDHEPYLLLVCDGEEDRARFEAIVADEPDDEDGGR